MNHFPLIGLAIVFSKLVNLGFGAIEYGYILIKGKPFLKHVIFVHQKLSDEDRRFLVNHISFYQQLTPALKKVFEHRTARIIKKKNWVPATGMYMTREMQVVIAAIQVKLTFGLRRYSLPSYNKVVVSPGPFRLHPKSPLYKGLYHPKAGTVYFSWKDLLAGLADPNDNLHLGLHEFTHALLSELYDGYWADTYFKIKFKRLDKQLRKPEIWRQIAQHPYFRAYAQTNKMEFFAVAVEHFFETPSQFQQELPAVYKHFVAFLNFDPINFSAQ